MDNMASDKNEVETKDRFHPGSTLLLGGRAVSLIPTQSLVEHGITPYTYPDEGHSR